MFTGIITDVGRVIAAEERGDLRLRIACGYDMANVDLGASIACSGVCLTVVDKGEDWSPRRALLTRGEAVDGWEILSSPQDVFRLHDVNDLLVEGGSATATAFLAADLVDRMLIYRAPILIGEGKSSVGFVGLDNLADAQNRWRLADSRPLGIDRLEVYDRLRE